MERSVRKFVAFLTLAAALAAVVVLLLPPAASSKSACPGIGTRVRINGFDPHKAKAGSNTVVTVWGTHLSETLEVAVGPKGAQTLVLFNYVGDTLQFVVPPDAVSGPIEVISCTSTAWSHSSLRV